MFQQGPWRLKLERFSIVDLTVPSTKSAAPLQLSIPRYLPVIPPLLEAAVWSLYKDHYCCCCYAQAEHWYWELPAKKLAQRNSLSSRVGRMQKAFSGQTRVHRKRFCTENILWTSTPDPHQTCLSHHLRILVNVFRDICFVLTNLYNIIWHHKCYERINQNIFLVNVGFTIDPLSLCETSFHIFQTLSQL